MAEQTNNSKTDKERTAKKAEKNKPRTEKVRTVLIVDVNGGTSVSQHLFKAMYARLVTKLQISEGLTIVNVDSISRLEKEFSQCDTPRRVALLFTNEAIATHLPLRRRVKKYIKDGAIAIIGCLFPSYTTPERTNALFREWEIPWRSGNAYRTSFRITDTGEKLFEGLTKTYSCNALQLAYCPEAHKVYKPVDGATYQSVPYSVEKADKSLTMAAFTSMGRGAVAYVGDFDEHEATDDLIVAFCHSFY